MTKIILNLFLAVMLSGFFVAALGQKETSLSENKNTNLTVDLSGLSYRVEKLFFTYYNTTSKFRYTDSVVVGDQRVVEFKTALDEPILAQLIAVAAADPANADHKRPSPNTHDFYSLYIEPGALKAVATDSFSNIVVTGSATHTDYLELKAKEAPYQRQLEAIYQNYGQASKDNDTDKQKTLLRQIDSIDNIAKEEVYKKFVLAYGETSPVAIYALSQYTGFSIDPKNAQPLYDQLGVAIRQLPAGIAFQNRIKIAGELGIGRPAFDFTQADTLGQPVNLSSLRGKYVLIDFWASWCGPCRAENPNVVKAFTRFKEKGFTVLGVSLDRPGQKEAWLKAIHDDGLAWTQVSDLRFWDNEVARLYDVKAIPQNFLIDKEGNIVAKNIRGDALESTLQQVIKE